jgi:poly(3-hydroxybutyrate) depolymerase
MRIEPDERTEQRSYYFDLAGEEMPYVLYVSSKVTPDKKAPLIIALHGLGGDGNFLLRGKLVDLAEEQGYIVAAPMGYNVSGWYGSPPIHMGNQPAGPDNLEALSEGDVMSVLALMQEEFNVDENRTYLLGHSMGGAGSLFLGQKHTDTWAAIAAIAPAAFMMQPVQGDMLGKLKEEDVPVIIIQGGADTVVPPTNTRTWADTMDKLAMESRYIELPEGDHGNVITDGMEDIFAWFAEHPKQR